MSDSGDIAKPDDGETQPLPGENQQPSSDERGRASRRTEMGFGFHVGPAPNPLLEKLTSDQVSTLIEQDGNEASGRRRFRWGLLVGGIIAITTLSWLFLAYDQAPMLGKVLTHLIAFLGGTGVGWGITKRR